MSAPAPLPRPSTVDAMVGVRLDPRCRWDDFDAFLCTEPVVREAWHLAGDVDVEFRLSCADLLALRAFLGRLRGQRAVEHVAVGMILRPVTSLGRPRLVGIAGGRS
ncbi:Lrp/AsnC ligand binding domain-containing protein [Fodinicola acaciae]|uniref:Lrp/AsnC ligand binding domain-containing protein n=1 Tax=Fodinicola acaciae TaxID=2681555 RepID=UPI0013D5120D|nr:Lrp/AsnC ligand binding domain-containing protein [Fodinicola acaciae]